jgi:hypothetical protein
MEMPDGEPVDTPSRCAPQVLCTSERFGRNKRRKGRGLRLRPQDTEIQDTKTESKQHNCRWENSHETMQIEDKVHRRRGMVMPLERGVCFVEGIRMHKAHDSSHCNETGNQCSKNLPGLGDRDSHHGYLTPIPPLPSPPASRHEMLEKRRPTPKCRHRGFSARRDA